MDTSLKEIFERVEKYVAPLISSQADTSLSKEENRILALQQINRLNQRIGMIARTSKNTVVDMKALQTFVNALTVGVKNDNVPQIKYGISQARNMILTIANET